MQNVTIMKNLSNVYLAYDFKNIIQKMKTDQSGENYST